MGNQKRPFVWQMIREAVEILGGKASYGDIIRYIKNKYGDVNENTIRCQIIACTVNHPSRVNFPQNKKTRDCSTLAHHYDFLFSTGKGEVVLYHPEKHGKWMIVEEGGKLRVKGPSGTLEPGRKIVTEPSLDKIRNPLLKTAIYSLMNALEFFQKEEERHRQGALIFMDQAVEYVLKAKLFQIDEAKFIGKLLEYLDYGRAIQELEKCGAKILDIEKVRLKEVHKARNDAQHRAKIADSIWTPRYMEWVYQFMKRFCMENFEIDVDSLIPSYLRAWL